MVDGEWVDYDDCQLPCGLIILCICLLSLMFVIATIHVVVFLFDSHLKAFQTVLL